MSYNGSPPVVYVDVETTGLDNAAHVMQIAAKCGRREFNVYILPGRRIHPGAAAVNGFQRDGSELYVRGRQVRTLPLYEATTQFINFIRKSSNGDGCVLVAHKASFDAYHLLKTFDVMGLYDEFEDTCQYGFADTLSLFREKFPYLQQYSVKALLSRFAPDGMFQLHNALGDVRALNYVVDRLKVKDWELYNAVQPFDDFY